MADTAGRLSVEALAKTGNENNKNPFVVSESFEKTRVESISQMASKRKINGSKRKQGKSKF